MKKDITIPEVKDVHIAAIPSENSEKDGLWDVYIINNKNEMIEGVMITSRGYGDDQVKTSVMRHVIGNNPAKTAARIEPISKQVFGINNEYWVTFFSDQRLMEKKYIFGAHTIVKELLEDVPVLNSKGVVVW